MMDASEAAPVPSFGRHETFHPRYGWLKKAYDRTVERPDAFRTKDSTVRFGVGRNMVSAIKHWSLAFKITTEHAGGLKTTGVGDVIFGDGGLDPYLERRETLWILHWLLMAKPCRMPTWWLIMNRMAGTVVGTADLTDAVQGMVRDNRAWGAPSPASVRRDVDAFLHTYTSRRGKMTMEEYVDCPFRSLGLVRHDGDHVRFMFGPKTGLSPHAVAFACADFADRAGAGCDVSVARLAAEPGGVGRAFKMGENDLAASLEAACRDGEGMSMTNVNGEPHLMFGDDPGVVARRMLVAACGPLKAAAGAAA